jgi:peptide deformylase
MAIRKIARLGEPTLRKAALPISAEKLGSAWLQQLTADLVETMRDAEGAGLAAPQIYEPVQLCALEVKRNLRYPHFPEIPLTLLINPQLTPLTASYDVLLENESVTLYEGCLSIPGLRGRVTRPRSVRLSAITPDGKEINEVWTGVAAAILQHEVDHLHGCLFIDRADPLTLCFQQEYERYVPVDQRVIDHALVSEGQG